MKIDREQWGRISALLDTALELAADEREAWLDRLSGDASALKEPLRTLLAQRAHIETSGLLKAPDFAAALRAEAGRAQTPPAELQPEGEAGPYRLVRELGRGGMGSVWLARRIDGKLKRQVALKFPYAGPNQRQLAERLARERDILASLEHPNIARLYDADVTSSGQPFLVLEYVDGVPINDYCDQHGLTIRQRLALFLQVLNAVHYAHTHLIIHRDLKPSNILIRPDGVAQLLDFGIAKLIPEGEARDSAITQFGGRALTPEYASPEQISGAAAITTACDVYSLGVILYELLTGNRPYRLKRDNRAALEEAITQAAVIAPSRMMATADIAARRSMTAQQLGRQLRGDLDTIVLKALRREPGERYVSADAFMRDIECALNNQPVDAQPHSRWYLLGKLVSRNRLAVGTAALVMLLLTIGIAATTWQAQRARASERRAIAEAATSDAVKQFMIRIFQTNTLGQEDAAKARQKNALELLEDGADRVGIEFGDNPALHREMLAVVLRLLGESRSGDYKKHALELLGLLKDTPDTGLQQAEIYNELSMMEYADTVAAADFAQTGLAALGPSTDAPYRKQRAMLLSTYAHILQGRGDFEGTMAPLSEARRLLLDGFSQTAEFGRVLSDLGWTEIRRDHVAAAIDYFEQAMRAYQSDPTTYQRTIAQGHGDLSAGYSLRKQYALAERELRLAAEGFMKSYGAADPETALANARMAKAIALQNRYEEAIALLRPAIRTLAVPSSNFNPDYLLAGTEYLADAMVQSGRLRDAEPDVQHVLELAKAGPPLVQVTPLMIAAEHDAMRGRYGSAEAGARRAVALATKVYGAGNPRIPKLNNRLGRLLLAIGKRDEADALFGATMKSEAANREVFDSAWTAASVQHARVLISRNQANEAVPVLADAMSRYMAQPEDQRDINDGTELQLELGRALTAAGRAAEGLPYLARALELRQTQYAFSPRLAEAQVAFADCNLRLGNLADSRRLLAKATAIHAANAELGAQYRKPLQELTRQVTRATE